MSKKIYIKIKDKEIPVVIRNYTNIKNLKIYFKNNVLSISKPKFITKNKLIQILKENEEKIYARYIEITSKQNTNQKQWASEETIMYKGKFINIEVTKVNGNKFSIELENESKLKIQIPIEDVETFEKKEIIDKLFKRLLKQKTIEILNDKLPKISQEIGIKYNVFKVQDAITRYGSCNARLKSLNFTSRLIMLPEDKIEAVIIHELCHIVYPNHSKEFYNLVLKHKPDYFECNKWLKENAKYLNF